MFFVIFINILIIILQMIFGQWLERHGYAPQTKEIEVDEDLPNVYDTLTTSAAQTFIQSNAYMQQTYGFEFQDPDTIEALEKIRTTPMKVMTGTPWYHLMANPSYGLDFNYIGPNVPEREKLIEDGFADRTVSEFVKGREIVELTEECKNERLEQSDMVMVLLNLAYIPDSVVMQVDFSKSGWMKTFKDAMENYKVEWEQKNGDAFKARLEDLAVKHPNIFNNEEITGKWKWQDEQLETMYNEFMAEREKVDDADPVKALSSGNQDKFQKM